MPTRALVVALLVPLAGCGRTKFQEFSPSDGDFTVLLPGSPDRKEQDVAGMKVGVYEVGHRSGTFKVMFADLPLVPPADFLGAAVTGLADQRRGTVVTRSDAGQNGREFEIETADPKGFVSGRVIAAGNRLYFLTAEGKNLRLSDSDVRTFLDSFKPKERPRPSGPPPGPAAAFGGPPRTPDPFRVPPDRIVGGGDGPEFRELAPTGGLLVGFEVGYVKFLGDNDVIGTIRPIFRAGDQETVGRQYGTDTSRMVRIKAKPGYAVGAIDVRAGLLVDAFSVTFMRIDGDRLDPNDSYESTWMGGGGGGPSRLGGDGPPVVGIRGRANQKDLTGLGLVFRQ